MRFEESVWQPGFAATIADFNGDGRSDVFFYNPRTGAWAQWITKAVTLEFMQRAGRFAAGWTVYRAVFDGDSRDDLFLYNASAKGKARSAGKWAQAITQSSLDFVVKPGKTAWAGAKVIIPADFSGDKLSDVFLMTASGKWTVATFTSKGPKFKGGQWAAGWSGWRADFNTDLLADLLLYNPKNGKYRVVLRKGTTFTILKGAWNRKLQVSVTDLNGDGLTDAVVYDAGSGSWGTATAAAKAGVFVYRGGTFENVAVTAGRPPETALRTVQHASRRGLTRGRETIEDLLIFESCPNAPSLRGSRARTARIWPNCCSTRAIDVFGVTRRLSSSNYWRIEHLLDRIELRPADLLDQLSLIRVIGDVRPHEFYNLAAMSFVPASWDQPFLTGEFNSQGVTRVLEAIRHVDPTIRLYQASSSEMYGKVREVPQTEMTPFYPRSPYGVSKVFGHYITVNYRESYGLFACSGILFNHESPRRGLEFVTRKVTDGVARIKLGLDRHAGTRQPRRAARLGLCRRLRARDVADAAAGPRPTTTSSPPA